MQRTHSLVFLLTRFITTCLPLVFASLCAAQTLSPAWAPDNATLTALHTAVDARYAKLFAHDHLRDKMTSIDTAALVLDAAATHDDPVRIGHMLDALSALQDHDPASKTYGNILWYQGDTRLVDRNGIEFVTRHLVLLWQLYANQIGSTQREHLRAILELARTGITHHSVAVSYTNITLMKAWNLIALGDGLDDPTSAALGHAILADWVAHTRVTGINEYLSPSYFQVDLENLALIRNLARDPDSRQLAQAGLDWLWEDIALNWYSPADRLGGTHSRDYDRLYNIGGLNPAVSRAGWSHRSPHTPAPARSPYEAYAWAAPDPKLTRWLQGPFPRSVGGRFGDGPEKRYLHYMDRDFSIASAQSGYNSGHDNSPLVINLGGGVNLPVISFFMDGRHDYYGQNKTLEAGSGHMKALHLRPFLSSVQHDNQVLFVASARDTSPDLSALESVITLPSDAEYWIDDEQINVFNAVSQWTADPDGDGVHTRMNISTQADIRLLVISDQDIARGVGVSERFAVQAGQRYRLRAALRGGPIFLYLNFLDANAQLIGTEHAISVTGGGDTFQWREQSLQAPPGAVWCKAWLYSTTGNRSEVQVSDLRFERLNSQGEPVETPGQFDFLPYKAQQFSIPTGAALFVRRQGVAAALRPLGTWDVAGQPIDWSLFNDGLTLHALRITATHSATHTEARATLAFWASAQGGMASDSAFRDFRHAVMARTARVEWDGRLLDAALDGPTPLHLRADIEAGRILLREGMSPEPPDLARWVTPLLESAH